MAPPSRLLTLIGQALKWQREHGLLREDSEVNIFSNVEQRKVEDDGVPNMCARIIQVRSCADL